MQITVQELMTRQPPIVRPCDSVAHAVNVMLDSDSAEVYVVNEEDQLLGVLAEFEVLKAHLYGLPGRIPVGTLMNCQVQTVPSCMRIVELAPRFRDGSVSHVAVIEDGCLVGRIRRRDILRLVIGLEQLDEAPAAQQSAAEPLRGPQFMHGRHDTVDAAVDAKVDATPTFLPEELLEAIARDQG